jgi:hypothetical protein
MQKQAKDFWAAAKLVAIGVLLLAVIFAVPDSGYTEHKSIFAVAAQSPWGHPFFDWASAWCSVKIILMALAGLAFVKAVLGLVIDTEFEGARIPMFTSAILPLLLGSFGLYELIKSIL